MVLCIFNGKGFTLNKVLKGHSDDVMALLVLKDGHLASASLDGTIKLWGLDDVKCLRTLSGHGGPINCIIEGVDGQLLST